MDVAPRHVSVVVFPQTDPSVLYGVFDTLWGAGRLWQTLRGYPAGNALFTPRVTGARKGIVELVTGVSIVVQDGIDDVRATDIVFLPNIIVSSAAELRALDRTLLAWVRERYEAGADVYASCGGPLALAEAGLLDGLEATTHWGYVDIFRQAYPQVTVHPERILVQAGPGHRIVCSGGASSWQDLTLYLVAKYAGPAEAIRLSKVFQYQWHRDGQLPCASMLRNVTHDDALMQSTQAWLGEHYERPTGLTPAEYRRKMRLPRELRTAAQSGVGERRA